MSLEQILKADLAAGIADGCGARQTKTHEVDVLVGLFRTSLPAIERSLRAALAPLGMTVDVGGVFCHQSPRVINEVTSAECELGDLLLVLRFDTGGVPVHNALLLQTKIHDRHRRFDVVGLFERLKNRRDDQYILYSEWPPFRWKLTGASRRVRPARPHLGAQYGVIDACEQGCANCSISLAVPDGDPRPMSAVLVDFLFRGSGRRFEPWPVARRRRGWDRVIWELLQTTVRATAYSAAAAGTGSREWNTHLFLARVSDRPPFVFAREFAGAAGERAATAYLEAQLPPPDRPVAIAEAAEPLEGISFVTFEIRRQDDESEDLAEVPAPSSSRPYRRTRIAPTAH